MKERLKKNSGITLIALIITIIVMLILVAVTVNIANDNGNGLFGRARSAKVDTAYRAEQENLLMYMYGEDYDATTGKLNLEGVKNKLNQDTSRRWKDIKINDNFTELTVVGTQSGKTHTILSNGAIDGKNDSLQEIITSSTKNGSLDLDDLEKKLNDSDKWTDAKKDGDKVTVTDKETGKEYEISKDGTITEKNNQSSDTNLYEGKIWGNTVTDEKLKGLGYTDEEIATERTDKKVYLINVFSQYIDRFGNAKNKEEADSIIAEIIQIEGKAGSKSDTGEWIDITEPNEFGQAYSFGIKNSNFWWDALLSDTIVATWKVTEQTETKISFETTKEEEDKNGNTTTKTVNYPVFIGDNGNSIYFIMFGS